VYLSWSKFAWANTATELRAGRREKTTLTRRRSRGRPPEAQAATPPAWRRIDLHLHTPGSGDYQEPRAGYLDLLQRAEARSLDIIAFTDHNSAVGYAALEREMAELALLEERARILPDEARRLQEYRRLRERILVLPGFEFTATFGFHILGIFPPETTVRKLEHLLLEMNIPEDKLDQGASEVGATTDVLRAYEMIAGAGGLVIGAHANSTHGVAMIGLGLGGQTKIAYTQDPNLHALEVTDLESSSRRATARFFNGSKPEYPRRMHCIQGSDAHRLTRDPLRPEKNLGVGDRCTEVLLPEVSFAALKELFNSTDFGNTRPASPSEAHPFDPLTAAREDGATIVQAFHDLATPTPEAIERLLCDVVAFANTNGGSLYVGASADPREPIRGVEGAPAFAETLRAAAERQIVPAIVPDLETLSSGDQTVLVVTVPKGTDTPYALEPGYIFVRQEGETALALRDEIVQLVRGAAPTDASWNTPVRARPVQPPITPPIPEAAESPTEHAQPPQPPPPGPRDAQQFAVQQATAAERERQQERTPVPRTGVEIIASVERNGLIYHTVRDLRNRRVVRNVTRQSARRLWRYAILQVEDHTPPREEVRWDERDDRFGFWKGYRQPEGMRRYNLVYREPAGNQGDGNERLRIFFGVTEDGIDERWRAVLPPDSALPEVQYDEDLQGPAAHEAAGMPALEQEPLPTMAVQAAPAESLAPADEPERSAEEIAYAAAMQEPPPVVTPEPEGAFAAGAEAREGTTTPQDEEASAHTPRRRSRSRGGRRNARSAEDGENATEDDRTTVETAAPGESPTTPPQESAASSTAPVSAPSATAPPTEAAGSDTSSLSSVTEQTARDPQTTEGGEAPAPKRRRAPRRKAAASSAEVTTATEQTPEARIAQATAAVGENAPEPVATAATEAAEAAPPTRASRRRRAPRKAAPAPDESGTPGA